MLTHITIKNLALVEELYWQLDKGLISVTGETGAGKSVIVGALKLVLGERAVKGVIRTGAASCSVEAVFELADACKINGLLEESGIELCEGNQLLIRRVIGQQSNKQFINNSPATLNVLKHLGEYLVDLHGPHEHQSLLSVERQLAMLDLYARADQEKQQYQQAYHAWKKLEMELGALLKSEQANAQELDLLRFQVDEIAEANLIPGEEVEIEERYQRASNSSRILEKASQVAEIVAQELNPRLSEVQKLAHELEHLDEGASEMLSGLQSAVLEIQELEKNVVEYAQDLDLHPEEEHALEQRIHTFETLKRKYGATLEEVVAHHVKASERLDAIENRESRIEMLQNQAEKAKQHALTLGRHLSEKREEYSEQLAQKIQLELRDLGFKQAAFEVVLTQKEHLSGTGLESVEFTFGPNPGEPPQPLRFIASSGEISRVMLAVKSALADQDATPLMVFDEIDANVGGEIAGVVGKKMAALGARHQVIAITHFPQVAAVANSHFVVDKVVEDGRTRSVLREVTDTARVEELMRMLGGGDGAQSRAMAESLLMNASALN